MHGMYGFGSIWMIVFWIAFWTLLIIVGIYLLMKFISPGNKNVKNDQNDKNTPLNTLQERLAKGEINESEYEHLKSIIERDRR